MRAFISYSINDSEQYILSILAKRLKEDGFIVTSDYNLFRPITLLEKANLFIGIITATGKDNGRVLHEMEMAIARRIPTLLLIENKVSFKALDSIKSNIVIFDRARPEASVELVRNKIKTSLNNQPNNNTLAWVLGGLAVLAAIRLLSDDK